MKVPFMAIASAAMLLTVGVGFSSPARADDHRRPGFAHEFRHDGDKHFDNRFDRDHDRRLHRDWDDRNRVRFFHRDNGWHNGWRNDRDNDWRRDNWRHDRDDHRDWRRDHDNDRDGHRR